MARFLPAGLPTPARFGADAVHLARGCHPDQEDGRTQADSGVMPADRRPALPIRRQGRLQPPCTPCAVRNPLSAEGHVPDGDDRRPAVAGCPPSDRLIRAGGKRIWPGAGPPRPLPHPPDRHGLVRPGRHQGKAGALFAALGMFTALSRSFARRSSRLARCRPFARPDRRLDGRYPEGLRSPRLAPVAPAFYRAGQGLSQAGDRDLSQPSPDPDEDAVFGVRSDLVMDFRPGDHANLAQDIVARDRVKEGLDRVDFHLPPA